MEKQTAYLNKMVMSNKKWQEMEQYALLHQVPIMDSVGMDFLCQLIRIQQPKQILEIGTAIGYSALRMADALPGVAITSVERELEMVDIARSNIKKEQRCSQIEVIHGDAKEVMAALQKQQKKYDCIFIDAAKGQYKRFFQLAEPLINKTGLIICDNVLFRGFVADPDQAPTPRLHKLAKKIDDFNTWLCHHSNYDTTIVPIGDGVSISKPK